LDSLGGVLNDVTQFNPQDTGISQGVYAQELLTIPHNDTFYMIVTAFSGAWKYYCKTKTQ
jgi:alpha-N-arabinofuranosidase